MPPARDPMLEAVLEKMIDSQVANTQALTSLKDSLDDTDDRVRSIESFFQNGFRSDVKKVVSEIKEIRQTLKDAQTNVQQIINEIKCVQGQNENLQERVDSYKKIGVWAKITGGILAAIGTIIAGIIAILKLSS